MQSSRFRAIQLLLALTPFFYSCAMATEKVLLWPAIEGQILDKGVPVAGLELTQTLYWNYEENTAPPRVKVVKTDDEGRFVLPKIMGEISTGFLTRLFYQPGIVMEIGAHFSDSKYSISVAGNSSHFIASEPSEVLECDLQHSKLFKGVFLVDCRPEQK